MGAAMLLWTLTLLTCTASVISDPHYLVAFPAAIHHPSTETFCVLLRSLPETVHLTVTLETKLQNHTLLDKDVEKPGTYECLDFQVPAFIPDEDTTHYSETGEEVARVHVLIRKGDSVSFEERKKVVIRKPLTRNIIELDKPFYKPGETAKVRIVRLDEEFKAIHEAIPLIQLIDPNRNRIGQWVDVKPHHGIVDLSFPLSSEATLGTYIIKFGERYKERREFNVEEYVPHKFEVLFEVPQLVTTADKEVQVKVLGRYTYGKLVQGKVHLKLRRGRSFYFFEEILSGELISIELDYKGQTDKTGFASFTINATDLNLSGKGFNNYVHLSADLEEDGTGVTLSGEHHFAVVTRAIEVEFINLNPYYKHGFPYKGKMKFTVSKVPFKNQTVYLTVDVNDVETHLSYVTDDNGEVHFSLDTTEWNNSHVALRGRSAIFNVTQHDASDLEVIRNEAFRWVKPFYSESNSFLEIKHVDEELPCGKDQEVLVDYILDRKELDPEADHIDFYYLVVSRGRIVYSGQKQVPAGKDETLKGTFSLTLSTSSDLAPMARLLLYAVFADGEVAADIEVFTIDKCFKHKVKVAFSEKEELPGSKVNLEIEAAPGALCSLCAIDKSVALKENATLTPEKVYDIFYDEGLIGARGFMYHLEDFEPYPCLPSEGRTKRSLIAPWFQSQPDVYSLFQHLGIKMFTNTRVKKPVSCEVPTLERRLLKFQPETFHEPVPMAISVTNEVSQPVDSGPQKEEKSKPRTHFPETWVWNLVHVNEEGKANHPVTVPDTITEWNANAFCVADIGFGLSQQATLRVFQPFFVDPVLPYSVVRGETFELKAIVFNYLTDCIQVRVTLLETQEAEVKPCPACQFTTCLCADEAKTFSWNVTATQLGHVNFSITAEAEETQELCGNRISVTPTRGRSDTVIKSLLVKAEGVPEEKTYNAFLCSSGDPVVEEVSLQLPEHVVKDSGRATVSVIGDIMGAALQNIGNLLQMPFGCGEQNMAKFVPNIFVLQYLESTNQATPEIKAKATEYMKSGYQRQLLYKHDDGSYSAFGKRDAQGNTWLTAFVAKAFGQAKSYIYVDENHIHDAVHWLGQHQLPSGCFESVGKLFNNALKGDVDDDLSLTAYITASLLELHLEKNGTLVDDALHCLKKNLSSADGAYTKALLAYVFTLAGDTESQQQLLKELEEQADKIDGTVSFSETETTAYFLLAYLIMPEVSMDKTSQIVRALTQRQNAYGGFFSTQETVVGMQALAKYAALTYREIEDLKAVVKSGEGFQHEFHVDKKNQLVLQQASLPEVPAQYKVEVSGSGCAYVQTTLRYNHGPEMPKVFTLSVATSPKECNKTSRKYFDILLQVSYTGLRERSNMALIEVNMLSGFIPVKKSVRKLEESTHVKKVEFDPDRINIYLDELDKNVQTYRFSVEQEFEVTDLKPAIVKVYDYYHPDDHATIEYNAPCSTESIKKITINIIYLRYLNYATVSN
ncbi:alpha-2-macroglobulin-like protein 1 [Sceloporus undulatus]|uniref:alpha-2-macroglobulin-like protein 1 n=1 Tax=Sceloporus undulatus TaxID=8520 RepID=UPI001C4B2B84|nr:alpha-2-macroglobulin-like protein 1 [Sceloporus undulatus]